MLLDTSGIFAHLHKEEPTHQLAQELFKSRRKCITHSLVIAEFVTLASARRVPRRLVLDSIAVLLKNPRVEMIWVERQTLLDSIAFLESRIDKMYSLCDAASFKLMRQRDMTEALTTDHHFEQEGFRALLR